MLPGDDGRFSCLLGPRRPDGYDGPFIELSADAHGVLTRDYHRFPAEEARVDWHIEVVDHAGLDVVPDHTDAGVARSLRAALRFAQDVYALTPLILAGQNFLAPPYRAGDATHGYSMADACYCLGGFNLEPGQAAVITVRHPRSRFWNFTLWNQYMAALDVEYGRGGINIGTAVPNSDGSVTIVIAREQLEHPNALSTKDHTEGLMSFRWFHADEATFQTAWFSVSLLTELAVVPKPLQKPHPPIFQPFAVYEAIKQVAISKKLSIFPYNHAGFKHAHWINTAARLHRAVFTADAKPLTTQEVTRRLKRYGKLAGISVTLMNLRTLSNSHQMYLDVFGDADTFAEALDLLRPGSQPAELSPFFQKQPEKADARLHGIGRRSSMRPR